MTKEDKFRLANWLEEMKNTFKFLVDDPHVKDHLDFLDRSEKWVRKEAENDEPSEATQSTWGDHSSRTPRS